MLKIFSIVWMESGTVVEYRSSMTTLSFWGCGSKIFDVAPDDVFVVDGAVGLEVHHSFRLH